MDEWRVEGKKEATILGDKVKEKRQSEDLKKDIEKLALEIELFLLMLSLKREQDIQNHRKSGNKSKVVNGEDYNGADYDGESNFLDADNNDANYNGADYNGADYNGDGNYDSSDDYSGDSDYEYDAADYYDGQWNNNIYNSEYLK